jgi:O-antigen/teichoic acid export membrane protein
MPMALIGTSIGQVFYQKSAEYKTDKIKLKNLTFNTYKKLLKIGLIPFSIIMFYADYIFSFVFGKEWLIAGQYAQVLSFWILFVFITSPLTNLFSTLEKQKIALYFNIVLFLSRVLILSIGGMYLNAYMTILLYGITGALFWMFWAFYLLFLVEVSYKESILYTFKYLFIAVIIFGGIRIML